VFRSCVAVQSELGHAPHRRLATIEAESRVGGISVTFDFAAGIDQLPLRFDSRKQWGETRGPRCIEKEIPKASAQRKGSAVEVDGH